MSVKIADLLMALSAACMIGSMVLLGIDIWLILADRKKRREEAGQNDREKKETPEAE